MHVLDANEIFWMTFYTYDKIMEVWWKRWADAVALYIKLLKQTRMQETNQTYTLNSFIEEYFGWGHERTSQANKVLKKLWLIDNVVIRWNDWKVQWHYVRVNYLIDEEKVRTSSITYNLTTSLENQALVSTTRSEMATNALSTQYINAWNTQPKYNSYSDLFNIYYGKDKWIDEKACSKILDWLMNHWITTEEITKAMVLYNCECRVKQDYKYVKKLQTWLKEYHSLDDEQMDEALARVVREYREKKMTNEKFAKSKPSQVIYDDLCNTFWREKIKALWKSENTTQPLLHFI